MTNNEYYHTSGRYLDNFTEYDEEKYMKIAKVPLPSSFTYYLRKVIGNSTYICRNIGDYKVIAKCVLFLKPELMMFRGIPIPNETNVKSILGGIPIIEEEMKNLQNVQWVVSELELKLINHYYKSINKEIPYNVEFFDNEYYDDIDEFLQNTKEQTKNLFKDEKFYAKQLDNYEISTLVPEMLADLKAKHGKKFHRENFYNKLVKNPSKYPFYKFYGIFYGDLLLYTLGYWINSNVCRADVAVGRYGFPWYREHNIQTKFCRFTLKALKYKLYQELKKQGVTIFSIDGVGHDLVESGKTGLSDYKSLQYNRKMPRYIITLKG